MAAMRADTTVVTQKQMAEMLLGIGQILGTVQSVVDGWAELVEDLLDRVSDMEKQLSDVPPPDSPIARLKARVYMLEGRQHEDDEMLLPTPRP
jgi:hypothetical protein